MYNFLLIYYFLRIFDWFGLTHEKKIFFFLKLFVVEKFNNVPLPLPQMHLFKAPQHFISLNFMQFYFIFLLSTCIQTYFLLKKKMQISGIKKKRKILNHLVVILHFFLFYNAKCKFQSYQQLNLKKKKIYLLFLRFKKKKKFFFIEGGKTEIDMKNYNNNKRKFKVVVIKN